MVFGTLFLAAAWCVLTRELTVANAALGIAIGALLQYAVSGAREDGVRDRAARTLAWTWAVIELSLFFLYELVVSSVRVAMLVARPRLEMQTAVVTVVVEAKSEAELAVLSNLVTLTPGTLSLDASPDRRTLDVHVMAAEDPDTVRREIEEGLVRRVRRVFK